ncbi:MAG: methyltransferase family protein, partial [Candidatus Hodarchaeota archaeon]
MNLLTKKVLGIPILVIFMNSGFILFAGEVYNNFTTLIPILLLNLIISIDILIRPLSSKKDEFRRSILIISFVLLPTILILPYVEYKVFTQNLLTPFLYFWGVVTGIVFLFIGGLILLISRIQLGRYGCPRIVIETNHKLTTDGVYRFIRHPMYLGFLFVFFGYSLALGSIFMTMMICSVFFLIFRSRIQLEERLLLSEFGDEYAEYMERT